MEITSILNKVDIFLKLCQYVKDPLNIWLVPDLYRTQKMCNEEVQRDLRVVARVSDQFVTQEMCDEDFDDVLITWRNAYIKRKAQKAKIKEELMPVAWHPDRWWNWCVPEDEKQELIFALHNFDVQRIELCILRINHAPIRPTAKAIKAHVC